MKRNNRTQFSDNFTLKTLQKFSPTTSLTIRANKGLLHYYRRFQNLSIKESNNLLYYIQETTSQNNLSLSLLLVIFYKHTLMIFQDTLVVKQSRKSTISRTLIHRLQYLHKIA